MSVIKLLFFYDTEIKFKNPHWYQNIIKSLQLCYITCHITDLENIN